MAYTFTTLSSLQTVYLDVTAGSFFCSNFIPCASPPNKDEFDCGGNMGPDNSNRDCRDSTTGDLPPLEILVDYGDGSGANTWTRGNMLELWSHVYTRPGKYNIAVHSMSRRVQQIPSIA